MSIPVISSSPLLVLNASAGSGKTFSLVRNYLRLLLTDGEEKTELGQIVAMTFTNKAALEMKTRIMKDLHRLSTGKPEDNLFLIDMAGYLGMQPERVRINAATVLRKLLHQYENFNVLTIDKFNLKLIRSFSRDLNLPEKFDIVLNETQLLDRAIDELLDTIDASNKGKMYHLALNFSKKTLSDQTSWDVKKGLVSKAGNLTKETFFPIIQSLVETEITAEQEEKWKLELLQLESVFNIKIEELRNLVRQSGLEPESVSGKGTTYKRLLRLTVENGFRDDADFFSMTSSFLNNIQKTADSTGIHELTSRIDALNEIWQKNRDRWHQLNSYFKQLPILKLLRELAISMNSIREREATILISEFNKLISQLVKNEDAPFIYERLGSRYQHFFLDEFQDTSHLQWMNLVPMVHESLAQNKFNFIVGDPKQSIYRFKNGVAEQFVCLPRIYNPDKDPRIEQKSNFFHTQGGEKAKSLDFNWRSAEQIVAFNNLFFETIIAQPDIPAEEFYAGLKQEAKGKAKGYVHIECANAGAQDDNSDTDDGSFSMESETKLLQYVQDCLTDGYQPGDICILARVKNECNSYANTLKNNGYQVVSVDSLLTHSDHGVRLLVDFLKWRSNPQHVQRAQVFASSYFNYFLPQLAVQHYSKCFIPIPESNRLVFSIPAFLQEANLPASLMNSTFSSIYGLLETTIQTLKLNELENSYLHQLLDIAYQYDTAMGPSLEGFLEHYNSEGYKSNVMIPENSGAIKVMTAHKSKGLEFPVVIIPSLNFFSSRTNNLLVKTVDFVVETGISESAASINYLSERINKEKNAALMDALNLLYVAFTRPIDRLYAFGLFKKGDRAFSKNLLKTLQALARQSETETNFTLEWGEKPERSIEKESEIAVFQPKSLDDHLWFPEISLRNSPTSEEEALYEQLRLGRQFHSIMEEATTIDSAKTLIETGISNGTISISFKESLELMSENFFQNEDIRVLLSEGKQLNERTLLVDEQTRLRPDKLIVTDNKVVVLDFKTGDELPKHQQQIQAYASVLRQIGYEKVEAYLYYSSTDTLKAVAV